ncbi:MAG: hypothetical protein M3Y35_02845 [Actinomycetota bacterium]|nr:hypothetical protein [Actinomycetota bacterium]
MNAGKRLIAGLTTVLGTVILMVGFAASPASAYPPGTAPTLTANASTVTQGSTFTLSGTGFNGTVSLVGHSASVDLGTAEASGVDGTFTKTVTIAAVDFPVGDHSIVASDSVGDSATVTFRVEAAGTGGGGNNGGGSGNNGGGASNGGSGSNGDGGGLAYTGVAVLSLGGIGVLLLIGGGIMLMAGRRRNATV